MEADHPRRRNPVSRTAPARRDDSLIYGPDFLAMGVRHGAIALDVPDNLPGVVADLQAARGPDCRHPRGVGARC